MSDEMLTTSSGKPLVASDGQNVGGCWLALAWTEQFDHLVCLEDQVGRWPPLSELLEEDGLGAPTPTAAGLWVWEGLCLFQHVLEEPAEWRGTWRAASLDEARRFMARAEPWRCAKEVERQAAAKEEEA